MPQATPEPEQVFGDWRRTGHCCRCGDCCLGNPFTGAAEGYCPLFTFLWDRDREGFRGHCTDRQHPYYLAACQHWPSHPDQIADKPNCTYVFHKVVPDGQ